MKHTGLKLEELDKKAVGALVENNLGSVHKKCHQLGRGGVKNWSKYNSTKKTAYMEEGVSKIADVVYGYPRFLKIPLPNLMQGWRNIKF